MRREIECAGRTPAPPEDAGMKSPESIGKLTGNWIVLQYNPLTDAPPAPGTHFNKITVEAAARKLIAYYRNFGRMPATWEEMDACENRISAFEVTFWVAAEAGVTMQEARDVVGDLAPELYADYWMERWPPPPREPAAQKLGKTARKKR